MRKKDKFTITETVQINRRELSFKLGLVLMGYGVLLYVLLMALYPMSFLVFVAVFYALTTAAMIAFRLIIETLPNPPQSSPKG